MLNSKLGTQNVTNHAARSLRVIFRESHTPDTSKERRALGGSVLIACELHGEGLNESNGYSHMGISRLSDTVAPNQNAP